MNSSVGRSLGFEIQSGWNIRIVPSTNNSAIIFPPIFRGSIINIVISFTEYIEKEREREIEIEREREREGEGEREREMKTKRVPDRASQRRYDSVSSDQKSSM